jgi:DegV family protein with EDD domain
VVKVICDSTGDLTPEIISEFGITTVPLNILFGSDSYRERVDLMPDQFYKMLVESKVHPTTSQPAAGQFLEAYQKLAKETDEIIVLTISGGISGTFESAKQAREMAGNICKIDIIDTRMTCAGLLLPTLKAARLAAQGKKLEEVAAEVRDILPRIRVYMIFDTLEYLRKGGRIGAAKALLGGLLKLNPILTLKDGLIHPVTQARGRAKAVETLFDLIKKTGQPEEVVLEDATTPEELDNLIARVKTELPKAKIIRTTVSPVIGVHTGPSVMVAGAISTA